MARILASLILLLSAACGFAQREQATVELGHSGVLVADAWNPLRLVVRDLPGASLEVAFDQGTLRTGEIPGTYTVSLPGSGGVHVFEDDLYVPRFTSLVWRVRQGDVVVASGAVDPRMVSDEPLLLIAGDGPSGLPTGEELPGRLVHVHPAQLPGRAAAYDPVLAVLVDSGATSADPAALAAAAAAGSIVTATPGALEASEGLALLFSGSVQRVGSGYFTTLDETQGVAAQLHALAAVPEEESLQRRIGTAVARATSIDSGATVPLMPLLTIGAVYILVSYLLTRFGGPIGVFSALILAAGASFLAFAHLRPPAPVAVANTRVLIGAGGLGTEYSYFTAISYSGEPVTLDRAAAPATPVPYRGTPDALEARLPRWSELAFEGKPTLATPLLTWRDDSPQLRGNDPVYVVGEDGPAGGDGAPPAPALIQAVAREVPAGTALAVSGGTVHVALPAGGP